MKGEGELNLLMVVLGGVLSAVFCLVLGAIFA